MVEYRDAVQISTRLAGELVDLVLVAKNGDPGDAVACADGRCLDSPDVLALRQNNVLQIGGCSLAYLLKDHIELTIQPNPSKLAQRTGCF